MSLGPCSAESTNPCPALCRAPTPFSTIRAGSNRGWPEQVRPRDAFAVPNPGDPARTLAEALFQEVEGGDREDAHVVEPVAFAGLDRDRALRLADHRDAGMPGGMPVAAAGRAGGAGLAK